MIKLDLEFSGIDSKKCESSEHYLHQLLLRNELGFLNLHTRAPLWQSIRDRMNAIRGKYSKHFILGIGGSSLGAKAIQNALALETVRKIEFLENVDPVSFWRAIKSIEDIKDCHFVVISKSGTTMETLAQLHLLHDYYLRNGGELHRHCTVITEKKSSPLSDWAGTLKVPTLEMPSDVGGRFSVLSPVGMFPAALMGLNIDEFASGMRSALENKKTVSDFVAAILSSLERRELVTYFWSYSDRLSLLGDWIQQLWAESLAKKRDRKGGDAPEISVPVPLRGANDQHSVLQQIVEGRGKSLSVFLSVEDSRGVGESIGESLFPETDYLAGRRLGEVLEAELASTRTALHNRKNHTIGIQVDKLEERELGELFMFFQLVVGTLGEYFNINAFDQPGVEDGKKLARKLLMN
ncbi:MAG: glucose-6-phosphate isomerase [Bdellovibrionales bacterium]|nr:glucose-6-phosphate isomerase [Bdellovibrionales bacterium]